jgi:hypothetical protein
LSVGFDELRTLLEAVCPDLVVICTSYIRADRIYVARLSAAALPRVPVLTLARIGEPEEQFPGGSLSIAGGPEALIEAAECLTRTEASTPRNA